MRKLTITLTLTPGRCRWCGCTDERACAAGCAWADRAHTLCSECAAFDHLVRARSAGVRKAVVEMFHEGIDAITRRNNRRHA